MTDMDFIALNKIILAEILEDIPDEYTIMMDLGQGLHYPVIDYSINDDAKEVILTPGDLDDENES